MFWVQFGFGPAGFKEVPLCPWDICLPWQQSLWTRVCGLSLGFWGQAQDSRSCVCVWGNCPAVVCPRKRQESFALSGPAPAPQQIRCRIWETKVLYFPWLFFCYCLIWGSLLLSGGPRQGAGTHPAASPFCPSLPPCRAVKGHAVKLLAEGKHSHGDSASPAVCWPREHTGSGCPAGHTGWQGRAVPWLRLGHEGRLIPKPVPGTRMLGKSQQPPGDSQVCSATGLLWLFPAH